jgi:hypothetical protein
MLAPWEGLEGSSWRIFLCGQKGAFFLFDLLKGFLQSVVLFL